MSNNNFWMERAGGKLQSQRSNTSKPGREYTTWLGIQVPVPTEESERRRKAANVMIDIFFILFCLLCVKEYSKFFAYAIISLASIDLLWWLWLKPLLKQLKEKGEKMDK